MPAALQRLAAAVPYDVTGGNATPADLVHGHALFEAMEAGRVVGAFSLGVDQYSDGRLLRCGAAAGEPGHDLVGAMVTFAELEARRIGARAMLCETRRPGLVRRLQGKGFQIAGFVMLRVM